MSTSELHITVEQARGRVPVTIIRVAGAVDAATYQSLQTAVDTAYAAGMQYLLFDLANVSYMSSAGLRVLHRLIDRLREQAAAIGSPTDARMSGDSLKSPHVKLLNPSTNVRRLLEISGFEQLFDLHTDLDAALASF
ncbi:MAG TPA: STAS domain-containing protein [Roseiflexaceae bacterium]|nr:STAS domain-containing protein [Roseiflexaceae bacterium]